MAGLAEFEPNLEPTGWKENFEQEGLPVPRVLGTWDPESHETPESPESLASLVASTNFVSLLSLFVSADFAGQTWVLGH